MDQILNYLIFAAIGIVVLILGAGLFNMFKGGSPNLSQKLMRARVIAQFVAIILLMVAAFFFAPR
ncbi:twin transmembrane helix small protein [Maritalea sp.]|uniref:twin transmembrane helix small protein n=1 Tax=Maritalea sp. TaxID=2003361 RepID=UPI003EF55961